MATDVLLLIPTPAEADLLPDGWKPPGHTQSALCGFGPIAAAARAAALIAEHRPQRVVLLGIAGTYQDRLPVGEAFVFNEVACCGVGLGTAVGWQSPAGAGWPQWPGDADTPVVQDSLPLLIPADFNVTPGLLITNCIASGSEAAAMRVVERFPKAVAEDMEGFGVATACALAGVPLTIVRGISNQAGDRDINRWQIRPAVEAAASLVMQILDQALSRNW